MKYLRPTREDLHFKAVTPKPKIDKRMITVEDALLFAKWAGDRYNRYAGKWYSKTEIEVKAYTTKDLWEMYQKFLGKKG